LWLAFYWPKSVSNPDAADPNNINAGVFPILAESPVKHLKTHPWLYSSLLPGICLSYGIKIAPWDNAFEILLLAILLTWASDVGGYAPERWDAINYPRC
jgi:hypothetical protein